MLDIVGIWTQIQSMNRLPLARRVDILGMLMEGTSLRATTRLADVSINTVAKLLVDLGIGCAEYHYKEVRNVRIRRLQCEEIWSFVGAKANNVKPEGKPDKCKDIWTWVALDTDSKLCVSYLVGGRDRWWAREFMNDCAKRVTNHIQITTDERGVYMDAVEDTFGVDIDYAQLQEIYGAIDKNEAHYPPTQRIGCDMKGRSGDLDSKFVASSFVERRNMTTRMGMRSSSRFTNAFSKKIANHAALVAIHFMFYNFVRIHKTLGATPAMTVGLASHAWKLEEIVLLAD
jgi:IS1 family transposase